MALNRDAFCCVNGLSLLRATSKQLEEHLASMVPYENPSCRESLAFSFGSVSRHASSLTNHLPINSTSATRKLTYHVAANSPVSFRNLDDQWVLIPKVIYHLKR